MLEIRGRNLESFVIPLINEFSDIFSVVDESGKTFSSMNIQSVRVQLHFCVWKEL